MNTDILGEILEVKFLTSETYFFTLFEIFISFISFFCILNKRFTNLKINLTVYMLLQVMKTILYLFLLFSIKIKSILTEYG